MLAAQTDGTAFIAAKLAAKTVITRIFFILTFTHYFSDVRRVSCDEKNVTRHLYSFWLRLCRVRNNLRILCCKICGFYFIIKI